MNSRSVRDITHDLISIEVNYHDMGASGDVQSSGGCICRQIIPAPFAADFKPFDDVVAGITGKARRSDGHDTKNNE
ncbi:MAG: hypothetical protein HQK56_02170 [Deltaproteobacteria bacterium]|nr:hypothetical protein [Deltaproteobacteria bacterium]